MNEYSLKILHGPVDIAGQASTICKAQKKIGYLSILLIFNSSVYQYYYDVNLNLDKKNIILKILTLGKNFLSCLKYDIYHFHYGRSLLPFNLDLPVLKLFKKKIVMNYWGSDIIQSDVAINYTEFTLNDLKEIYPDLVNEKRREKIRRIDKIVNKSIVGDFSLLPYSPNSVVIRQAIELKYFPFIETKKEKSKIIIVHAPTNRKIKGTEFIISAVEKLTNEIGNIELILVENKTHSEAIEIYKKADIIVDDILQGPYGIFAIECMALGKPVLCHIHKNLISCYEELPIINTNPDTIYYDLKRLIENPEKMEDIGRKGREYVEKNHDSIKIAKQLIKLYRSL